MNEQRERQTDEQKDRDREKFISGISRILIWGVLAIRLIIIIIIMISIECITFISTITINNNAFYTNSYLCNLIVLNTATPHAFYANT